MSSKDNKEERAMHSKCDKTEIMSHEDIEKLFELIFSRYQIGLETSVRSSDFIFDYVKLMHYKCHKINLNRGGSYSDSPGWIKNEKATTNRINKNDNKYFQYTVTIALSREEIKNNLQIISKNKPFISEHNWKGINYTSGKDDLKTFEKNNATIALNVLYI